MKKLVAVLGLMFLTQNVYPQSEESAKIPSTSSYDEPSTAARTGKVAGASLHLGLVFSAVGGAGIDVFATHGPNWQFGLGYYQGSAEVHSDSGFTEGKATLKVKMPEIYARYFVGNSFNLIFGLGQRALDVDIDIRSRVDADDTLTTTTKVTNMVLIAGIGNTWAWDSGFFIGGDWLVLHVPISKSVKNGADATGSAADELNEVKKDLEDLGDKLSGVTTASLAMLNIGWMF